MTSSSFTSEYIEVYRHTPQRRWSYADLDLRQREIAARVRQGGRGAILFSEVSPVITVGRRSQATDILFSESQLRSHSIELLEVDRGGLATYHGPGQWVIFWVESLERLTGDARGVKTAVGLLLGIALEAALPYRPRSQIRHGAELGVWSEAGKFAAVGVHIEQGVLLHGMSVNGYRTEQSFQGLRPCGLDLPVDYLLESSEGFEQLGQQLQVIALDCYQKKIVNNH